MENQLNLFGTPSVEPEVLEESGQVEDMQKTQDVKVKYASLEATKEAALKCKNCRLHETRTNVVFFDGNEKAKLMIIGEGPGANEDEQGLPFVGRAGKMLDKVFESVGFRRKDHLYICNIVKCRPPENRAPFEDEAQECEEYLRAQIKHTDPKIIILAGATAIKGVLKMKSPRITKMRGEWLEVEDPLLAGRKVMAIFHPSYLLRNEYKKGPGSPKAQMWEDIKEIKRTYEELIGPLD